MVPRALGRAVSGQHRSGPRVLGRTVTWCAGHAPVLMYHGVGNVPADPFALFITPERFREQMAVLSSLGLQGVSLGELGNAVTRGAAGGLVGITFDDGYQDVLDQVPTVLDHHGFSATFFAVSGLLGGENTWDPPPRHRLMDAADLRDLVQRGFEIGSHTATHVRLAGLEGDRLRAEVGQSRTVLAGLTGADIRSFCYPYGSVDASAVQAVRDAGYSYACAVRRDPALPTPLARPRVGVTQTDWWLRFAAKLVIRGC